MPLTNNLHLITSASHFRPCKKINKRDELDGLKPYHRTAMFGWGSVKAYDTGLYIFNFCQPVLIGQIPFPLTPSTFMLLSSQKHVIVQPAVGYLSPPHPRTSSPRSITNVTRLLLSFSLLNLTRTTFIFSTKTKSLILKRTNQIPQKRATISERVVVVVERVHAHAYVKELVKLTLPMSVLPSFKHVFSSIAETEPVARTSPDEVVAMHVQTVAPSSNLPLSSSQTDGKMPTVSSLPRITATTTTTKSINLPPTMIPNCDTTPNSEILNNENIIKTVSEKKTRPCIPLLPLELVSDSGPLFGFETRVPSSRQSGELEPLSLNAQSLEHDGHTQNDDQERVRRRSRRRAVLNAPSQYKRLRVQPEGTEDMRLDITEARPTISPNPDTSVRAPSAAQQPQSQPSIRIGSTAAPSVVHTPPLVDRTSSVSDPLRVSPSHLPEVDRRLCGATVDGGADEARRRGRRTGSGFFSGSGSGSGSGSVGGGHHGGSWQATASMFRSGSLRMGSLLESSQSAGASCDAVDRADTTRHGMPEPPQLLALARDSTGGAPADVLSIPAQRSLHSALSSRTLRLPGVGTYAGAPPGTSRTGGGGGIGCGALSALQWPTASDVSHLGGVRSGLTQGENGVAENGFDLVDDTDSLATKHTCVAASKRVDNTDVIQEESGRVDGNVSLVGGGGYDHRKWKQETITTTVTTTAGAHSRHAQEISDDAEAISTADTPQKQEKQFKTMNNVSSGTPCEEQFVTSNTVLTPTPIERKPAATVTTTAKTTMTLSTVHCPDTTNTTAMTSTEIITAAATGTATAATEAAATVGDYSSGEDHLVQCPQCPRRLRNQVTLQNHIRVVHDHNGNFRCTHRQCGLTFMWQSTLSNHVRLVHEKQRPYVCDECGKAFRWNSHLREHFWVVHKGEKPFKCNTCGKSFGRKNNMQKHMRKHVEAYTAIDDK